VELLILVVGLVALDVLAYFFAHDSREVIAPDHHDLAQSARRRGDLATFRHELAELDREPSRVAPVRF
jgi:hypothetical protein